MVGVELFQWVSDGLCKGLRIDYLKRCCNDRLNSPSGVLGNIGNSELVGSGSTKVALNEVDSGSYVGFIPILALAWKTAESITGHDFLHRWFGDLDSKALGQFDMNASGSIGFA
jgi:hypothetical protein